MSLSDPNNQKGLFLVCHTPAHLTPLPRLVHLPLSGWAIDVCVCVCVCAKDMTQHKQFVLSEFDSHHRPRRIPQLPAPQQAHLHTAT
jgi:hypothetical protein